MRDFHVQIFKAANIFNFLKLINSQAIEMNMIKRHEEMGIKPNTAHTGDQVPELHVSEVVFTSDNHDDDEPLL